GTHQRFRGRVAGTHPPPCPSWSHSSVRHSARKLADRLGDPSTVPGRAGPHRAQAAARRGIHPRTTRTPNRTPFPPPGARPVTGTAPAGTLIRVAEGLLGISVEGRHFVALIR